MTPLTHQILLGALVLVGFPFAFTAAESPPSVTENRAVYRRPPAIPFPDDNPFSEAKSALGEMLFFDPLLSGSRARSCATCHNPSLSWADGLPRASGEKQVSMALRSPSLIDVAFGEVLGWDGKFKGQPASSDVYSYSIEVICNSSYISTFQGDVTLIR